MCQKAGSRLPRHAARKTMKKFAAIGVLCIVLLLSAILLTSCAGSPNVSGAPPKSATTEFIFVCGSTTAGSQAIQTLRLDSASGLQPAGMYSLNANQDCKFADPKDEFLFAVNYQTNEMTTLRIDSNAGTLSQASVTTDFHFGAGLVFVSPSLAFGWDGPEWQTATFDRASGNWQVLHTEGTDQDLGTIFPAHNGIFYSTAHACTPGCCGSGISAATVDPDGSVRSTWAVGGEICAEESHPAPLNVDLSRAGYDATGTHLIAFYAANPDSWTTPQHLGVLSRDLATGALTPLTTRDDVSNANSGGLAVHPNGFVYAAALQSQTITVFRIGSDYSLISVPQDDVTLSIKPRELTLSPDGRFLLVIGDDGTGTGFRRLLHVFQIDGGTGALTPVKGSPFTTEVAGLVTAASR
jgi:hypothetical protein